MTITLTAGARPNFMKIAPIIDAIKAAREQGKDIDYTLVHTGQHYDVKMSEEFFVQLGIPEPDINLGAGGGTQAEQTAAIMTGFERYLADRKTDLVLVVGDVTSTLACSIVAKKLLVPVAHVEGGIRSRDMTMPEEINRIVTDSISDYFFTTSQTANENLKAEGKRDDQIFFVGNTMIDTLMKNMHRLRKPALWDEHSLAAGEYFVMTLHRPSNVDTSDQLVAILNAVRSTGLPVVFPVHPRTRKNMTTFGIAPDGLILTEPLGYLEFNYLVKHARGVITDSGGITEETTFMGIPCLTLRNSTERPETCTVGTNELLGTDPSAIAPALARIMSGKWKKGSIPELWDGKAAERIVEVLVRMGLGGH
ncbi:MAG: UDP-N-acetylglucosamine 2-epimerase (non-hydrolyzing) [Cyclobacteriaceae bacterium]|nr:UDP-N-acetylglucosamine 2-epimerase (non-hydrolyzing) [Cyclobacteriaceae bacterium]